jgi:hypothetical protein
MTAGAGPLHLVLAPAGISVPARARSFNPILEARHWAGVECIPRMRWAGDPASIACERRRRLPRTFDGRRLASCARSRAALNFGQAAAWAYATSYLGGLVRRSAWNTLSRAERARCCARVACGH